MHDSIPLPICKQEINVETLFVLAVITAVGYWIYRTGKRTGSRKGYNVGRRHGRNARRRGRRR